MSIRSFSQLLLVRLKFESRRLLYFFYSLPYYKYRRFRRVDLKLMWAYFCKNPYRLSKKYLLEKGESEIYSYGETPIHTLKEIVTAFDITPNDTIYELGCGRGRASFWLALVLKAQVVGVDYVPEYIAIAKKICRSLDLANPKFLCEDFLKVDLTPATVLYLNGTCLKDEEILQLIIKLKKAKKGTKLITTSFSMQEYGALEWKLEKKELELPFSWGIASVYLQIKN